MLQVGNGQITRSRYRQLDEAPFERFEPFGRVRDNEHNPKEEVLRYDAYPPDWSTQHNPEEAVLQLVGRDTKTGALVRYDAYPPDWSTRGGPLNLRTGWATLSVRVRTRFPTVRKDAVWSGPGCGTGFFVLTKYRGWGG